MKLHQDLSKAYNVGDSTKIKEKVCHYLMKFFFLKVFLENAFGNLAQVAAKLIKCYEISLENLSIYGIALGLRNFSSQ